MKITKLLAAVLLLAPATNLLAHPHEHSHHKAGHDRSKSSANVGASAGAAEEHTRSSRSRTGGTSTTGRASSNRPGNPSGGTSRGTSRSSRNDARSVRRVPQSSGLSRPQPPAVRPAPGTGSSRPGTTAAGVGAQPRGATVGAAVARPAPELPGKNITIALQGSFQGVMNLEAELTGTGPNFVSEFVGDEAAEGLPKPIANVQFTVKPLEEGYRIECSIGARIAMVTSTMTRGDAVSRNIEFRDLTYLTTVVAKDGEPVTLSKINGKRLTLIVEAAK